MEDESLESGVVGDGGPSLLLLRSSYLVLRPNGVTIWLTYVYRKHDASLFPQRLTLLY